MLLKVVIKDVLFDEKYRGRGECCVDNMPLASCNGARQPDDFTGFSNDQQVLITVFSDVVGFHQATGYIKNSRR